MVTKRYSNGEVSKRAKEIFARVIKPKLTPADNDKFVAIDIESKDYELGTDRREIVDRLLEKNADAQIMVVHASRWWVFRMPTRFRPAAVK